MRILIVIPTWNREELIDNLEGLLLKQIRKGVDAIIIGRFGERKPIKRGKRGGCIRYLPCEASLVESLDIGLHIAMDNGYQWAVMFDDDVLPNDGYIDNFLAHAEESGDVCCMGGSAPQKIPDVPVERGSIPMIHWEGTVSGDFGRFYRKKPTEVGQLQGCNWAVRLDLVKKCGIRFDTHLSRVGFRSETDFQFRLARNGYTIMWYPGLTVAHLNYTTGSFAEFEKDNYWRGQDHARFSIKNFGILKTVIGLLFTGRDPRPIWWGVPVSLILGRKYISTYRGYIEYLAKQV